MGKTSLEKIMHNIPRYPVKEILNIIDNCIPEDGFGIGRDEFVVLLKLLIYGRMTASNIARLKRNDVVFDNDIVVINPGKKEKEVSIPGIFIGDDIKRVIGGKDINKGKLLPMFFNKNAYYLMKKFFTLPIMREKFPESNNSFLILKHIFLIEISNRKIDISLPIYMYRKLSILERVKVIDIFSRLNGRKERDISSLANEFLDNQ